jgi:hypothetical protein
MKRCYVGKNMRISPSNAGDSVIRTILSCGLFSFIKFVDCCKCPAGGHRVHAVKTLSSPLCNLSSIIDDSSFR